MTLDDTLATIKENIDKYTENRVSPAPVTILAASKGQPAGVIENAIRAGITDFGENRVQEAQAKWPALKARYPQARLHLIGPLQTNKLDDALSLFDVIQTVDRPKLAEAISRAHTNIPCYIQVNTGNEPQKAGVIPEQADAFIRHCRDQLGLHIQGLMCIPPHNQPPAPHFALLQTIAQRHGLAGLSMGMSEDYTQAVRMGATCIRLGRVLFGERPDT